MLLNILSFVFQSDAISMLEKELDFKDEHLDFIQQHIRKFCLKCILYSVHIFRLMYIIFCCLCLPICCFIVEAALETIYRVFINLKFSFILIPKKSIYIRPPKELFTVLISEISYHYKHISIGRWIQFKYLNFEFEKGNYLPNMVYKPSPEAHMIGAFFLIISKAFCKKCQCFPWPLLLDGAAMFYTSVKDERNCDLLYRYLVHRIYGFPFTSPALVVDKDSVFVWVLI